MTGVVDEPHREERHKRNPAIGIALAANTEGAHQRRIWEAWHTDSGRGQRWAALLTAGARLQAADLDAFAEFPKPPPLEVRWLNEPGGPRRIEVDPCDPDYTPIEPTKLTAPPRLKPMYEGRELARAAQRVNTMGPTPQLPGGL